MNSDTAGHAEINAYGDLVRPDTPAMVAEAGTSEARCHERVRDSLKRCSQAECEHCAPKYRINCLKDCKRLMLVHDAAGVVEDLIDRVQQLEMRCEEAEDCANYWRHTAND